MFHDRPSRQELTRHIDGSVQVATWVVAQIQDYACWFGSHDLRHLRIPFAVSPTAETMQLQVSDLFPILFHIGELDRRHHDLVADQGKFGRFVHPRPVERENDWFALVTTDMCHRRRERHPLSIYIEFFCIIFDMQDQVTGLDARFLCRRALDRGDDRERTIAIAELDPDPVKRAIQIFSRLFVLFWG